MFEVIVHPEKVGPCALSQHVIPLIQVTCLWATSKVWLLQLAVWIFMIFKIFEIKEIMQYLTHSPQHLPSQKRQSFEHSIFPKISWSFWSDNVSQVSVQSSRIVCPIIPNKSFRTGLFFGFLLSGSSPVTLFAVRTIASNACWYRHHLVALSYFQEKGKYNWCKSICRICAVHPYEIVY